LPTARWIGQGVLLLGPLSLTLILATSLVALGSY
jgi:hypothetical protein